MKTISNRWTCRPVITAMGVISGAGRGVSTLQACLISGQSAIRTQSVDGAQWPVARAEVPEQVEDRALFLAKAACHEALEAHGAWSSIPPFQRAVVLGTTCGGVLSLQSLAEQATAPEMLELQELERSAFHSVTTAIAQDVGALGLINTMTVACASGSQSLLLAADWLESGRARAVLAGGFDTVSPFILKGFSALRALGTLPYRVFDGQSTGVLLGEGAAAFVLMARADAEAAGLPIYGELLGGATNNDAYAIARPDPDGLGIERCLREALESAAVPPSKVEVLGVHGTGNRASDLAESKAYERVFSSALQSMPISALKPLLGHLSGAAGAIEIAALLCAFEGNIGHLRRLRSAHTLTKGDERSPNLALKLSSGFGGNNCALVFASPRFRKIESPSIHRPRHRVFVSGQSGTICGFNDNLPQNWNNLSRRSAPLDFFEQTGFIATKESRRLDGFAALLGLSAASALKNSCFVGDVGQDVALMVGTTFGCWHSSFQFAKNLNKGRVNPVAYQNTVCNAALGYLAMVLGLAGPSHMYTGGSVAGLVAMGSAADLIQRGSLQRALIGAGDWLPTHNAKQPRWRGTGGELRGGFDWPRSGSAFLLLESEESLKRRGAEPLAELVSWGFGPPQQKKPLSFANNQHVFALPQRVKELYTRACKSGSESDEISSLFEAQCEVVSGSSAFEPFGLLLQMVLSLQGVSEQQRGSEVSQKRASLIVSDGRGGEFSFRLSAT